MSAIRIFTISSVRTVIFAAAVICSAAVLIAGQATIRPKFDRDSVIDVQHYTIRVSFDRIIKQVRGDTTVIVKPTVADLREFELDSVGLKFESVSLDINGSELKYKVLPASIRITLDRNYSPQETIAIRFKYIATPKKGIYFVEGVKEANRVNHSDQIWTQGEPDEARHWFPSFDFPSDKATTEEYITALENETVIGNGEFVDKRANGDGTFTWHFKMSIPHSTYLVSFVIGEYVRIDDKYGDISLSHYVYPGFEKTAHNAFDQTKRIMPIYEQLTGVPYPYNKYDQTIVASFAFGGMENITATTMADTEIFWGDLDFGREGVTDLVSHELAHSWFGDLVTCSNWAELWLNEGFATYMEAAYREKINGRADYIRKILSNAREFLADDAVTRRRHGLFNRRAGEVDKLFDVSAVTYNKGGVVIHMLREQIGTEAFWKGVNIYLNRHKFGSVASTDLLSAMEESSGEELDWFFDQWVFKSGAPILNVVPVYSARTRTLKLTVTQSQRSDGIVPAAFRLPLSVSIKTTKGAEVQPLSIKTTKETFTFKNIARPTSIAIDPEDKIPAKTVKTSAIKYLG